MSGPGTTRPMDPANLVHGYGGVEHRQPGPVEGCLLCQLEAVADAWFNWRQDDLDALLHEYRRDDE